MTCYVCAMLNSLWNLLLFCQWLVFGIAHTTHRNFAVGSECSRWTMDALQRTGWEDYAQTADGHTSSSALPFGPAANDTFDAPPRTKRMRINEGGDDAASETASINSATCNWIPKSLMDAFHNFVHRVCANQVSESLTGFNRYSILPNFEQSCQKCTLRLVQCGKGPSHLAIISMGSWLFPMDSQWVLIRNNQESKLAIMFGWTWAWTDTNHEPLHAQFCGVWLRRTSVRPLLGEFLGP